VESAEGTVCELSLTDLHGGAIGLVTARGRASSRSIGCLPASLRQASHRADDRHLDGVPMGAAPVLLRHVVRWEKTAPG
jgi:hypothetical protein